MAKSAAHGQAAPFFHNVLLFAGGGFMAVFLIWGLFMTSPTPCPSPDFARAATDPLSTRVSEGINSPECAMNGKCQGVNQRHDPSDPTFYDDPETSYKIGTPVKDWDEKRREWLRLHPTFAAGADERILMLTASQPAPCKNPIGDHLLLRFFKNKVDYCRIHGYDIFYNNALLQPKMTSFWAKLPVVRAAMMAHPEVEWIWWVDSDAVFTDMEFKLPLERYKNHNLIVHGWPHLIYEKKSWTGLNAGVFLIRNCQWSLDFMEVWAKMGPQSPDYEKWGQILSSTFKDKIFPGSDDQSGLCYLLLRERYKWGNKIYMEGEYYFEGYWLEIVDTLDNITSKYVEIEKGVSRLRRRHAERVSESYAENREQYLKEAGYGRNSWRRPFITHFTGCQPCSGEHNQMYGGESCWKSMQKALNFADNQVLRNYGFMHPHLLDSSSISPLPFDYPA